NLLAVINDILDLSKIEAGKLDIDVLDFNLTQLIEQCLKGLIVKAGDKGLVFQQQIDPGIEPTLRGDPNRLCQILLNLVSNALKFTEVGHISLEVTRIREEEATQWLRFSVMDTGIGIEQEFQQAIFNKFTQEDGSIVRK